jgi:hypothetical protein
MNSTPSRKYGADLRHLTKVDVKDLEVGKFYYIRMRNKDKGPDVWGAKIDFIGKINMIDDVGISFDFMYRRNADPRNGASVWKKENNRVLILAESFKHKNMEDNTTLYIDNKHPTVQKPPTRKTRKAGKK